MASNAPSFDKAIRHPNKMNNTPGSVKASDKVWYCLTNSVSDQKSRNHKIRIVNVPATLIAIPYLSKFAFNFELFSKVILFFIASFFSIITAYKVTWHNFT